MTVKATVHYTSPIENPTHSDSNTWGGNAFLKAAEFDPTIWDIRIYYFY